MGAPLFTETIVYVEVVNIIGTMIWYLLGGFSSRIGDFLFSQEHSIRYHFFSSCSIQEMQITAFIPIVLVSCASMLKFTGVGQSTVIS